MLNEKGLKCWKGSQITNKVSMFNAKGVKYWKGPQKLVKMSILVTFKISLGNLAHWTLQDSNLQPIYYESNTLCVLYCCILK